MNTKNINSTRRYGILFSATWITLISVSCASKPSTLTERAGNDNFLMKPVKRIEVGKSEGDSPHLRAGRVELTYVLEPTDAFRALIAQRTARLNESHLDQEFTSQERKEKAEKNLRDRIRIMEAELKRNLNLEIEGKMADTNDSSYLLVATEKAGFRSDVVVKLTSERRVVLGIQNGFLRSPFFAKSVQTHHLVGSFNLEDPTRVNGTITWMVNGEVFGKGTFTLRYLGVGIKERKGDKE